MEVLIIFTIIAGVAFLFYKLYQKIKNKRWFKKFLFYLKKFLYYLKVIPLSFVIVFLVYLFLKDVYAYLFYPVYPATIEYYAEYNSTDKNGVLTQNYSVVYSFIVDDRNITIEEGSFEKGKRRDKGTKVEVFYKNGEVLESNFDNLVYSFFSMLVGSLFMLFYIKKEEFPSTLVIPYVEEDEIIDEE